MSYTVATFTRLEKNADGTYAMVFTYSGAGEQSIEYRYSVSTAVMPTADYARGLAMERMAILNTNLSFAAGAQPSVGTQLDTTTPLPTPAAVVFGSYRASSAPFTPGATPQDVFTITGSASRSVRVTGSGIYTVQTTAGINAWLLNKRSAANSGGTSAPVTAVPDDPSYPAATATVRQYTANPTTAGTLVGSPWSGRIVSPAPASVASVIGKELESLARKPITLTGIGDVLAWNFNGAALPLGLSVQAWVSWDEVG